MKASLGRGADNGIQAFLFPTHCTTSWDLAGLGLNSHVTPTGLWK